MKVYLAGPITGETWEGAHNWRIAVSEKLRENGIEHLDPLRGKGFLEDLIKKDGVFEKQYTGGDHPLVTGHSILHRDMWDVSRCDIVFANLFNAPRPSIGTVMEIAWARLYGKYSILVLDKDGLHDHGMLLEAASVVIYDDFDEALELLWHACGA